MIFEQFSKIGVIPVIVLDDPKNAAPLAEILCGNGIPCAEIAFRTPAAEETIRIMTREFPDMLVGAGTILTTEQADQAMNAGAQFIFSPGLNPRVVQHCIDSCIPVTPGVQTASEIEQALELGLKVVRFFPAEQAGGLATIKALASEYVDLRFMPKGGISAKNLKDYLAYDKVIACGGTWAARRKLTATGEWERIKSLVREAASIVRNIRK
ncbi:MAG: bifunctional 4-hydroxy-2-oxoglutarate aldolase/2-dehydro-3-deoxy-phosphogluconate aldolase [Synergistaceae bacterium]|nr:bifunctional 4-hydroxy-2-oxoglutarate aldolase/2-dehydro-3-deoxy-phosphogluconate aldolase [Synergistaceae bacterium]